MRFISINTLLKFFLSECSTLSEKLAETQRTFDSERAALKRDIERLDKEATELKLEIVELQLEKSSLQQRVDEADRVTEEKVAAVETKRREIEGTATELKQTVSEVSELRVCGFQITCMKFVKVFSLEITRFLPRCINSHNHFIVHSLYFHKSWSV